MVKAILVLRCLAVALLNAARAHPGQGFPEGQSSNVARLILTIPLVTRYSMFESR
jgi:hypothetical protein